MSALGQSTAAARDASQVDGLNAGFYGRIRYPWPPHTLERYSDASLWPRMLNQDVGAWRVPRVRPDADVWVAGCGTNQAVITALRFPRAWVVGSDLSEPSLEVAAATARALAVSNLELVRESLNDAAHADRFDYVLCTGVIHHNADPGGPLARLASAVRPSGIVELMVYNQFQRVETAAFQRALRILAGSEGEPHFETELSLARRLVGSFRTGRMGAFLSGRQGVPEAAFADALLQPVEHSFTVESLAGLAGRCGLELLGSCVDAYSRSRGAVDWNLSFDDEALDEAYAALPDAARWQVTNLLLLDESPALWFYLQRQDAGVPRLSETELDAGFLRERFVPVSAEKELLVRDPEGGYRSRGGVGVPLGSPPGEDARRVLAELDTEDALESSVRRLGISTAPRRLHRLRLGLATSGFPYLASRALIEAGC